MGGGGSKFCVSFLGGSGALWPFLGDYTYFAQIIGGGQGFAAYGRDFDTFPHPSKKYGAKDEKMFLKNLLKIGIG